MLSRVQASWFCAWAISLVTALVAVVGRFGFNPTDQGYVLGQAWQIRHGAVPHLDAISTRPFGTEILHQVDFWLPGPLFVSSMCLGTLELVVATVWLAVIVLDRPVRSWGLPTYSLVTVAVLVNVHTFPLMAWPTIDGVALVAGGWLAISGGLRRGSVLLCSVGALACGFAPLTKQSFAAAPVIALVLLRSQRKGWGWILGCLLLPGLAYVVWVTVGGGFSAMTDQLLGGRAVYGWELVTGAGQLLRNRPLLSLLSATVVTVLIALAVSRDPRALRLGAMGFLALLAGILVDSRLVVGGSWGALIFWATVGVVLVRALRESRPPAAGSLFVLLLAWMVSLSWGYATPDLVAGSLLLLSVVELWRLVGAPVLGPTRLLVPLGLVGVVAVGALVLDARSTTYYDGPRSGLSASGGAFASGLRGIRMSPGTARYLQEIKTCLLAHPATHVAVLPDNPLVYPLLDLDDPFPEIWVLPSEMYGKVPSQLITAARRLGREGDFLVLFQTYSAFDTAVHGPVVPPEALFVPGLQHAIAHELRGEPVRCGSLVGVYQPARLS